MASIFQRLFGKRQFLLATKTRPRKDLGFSAFNLVMATGVGVASGYYIFMPLITDLPKYQRESIRLKQEKAAAEAAKKAASQ